MAQPAWQTDELAEEWIEECSAAGSLASSDISLTEVIASLAMADDDASLAQQSGDEMDAGGTAPRGTFVVREDVKPAPLLPKTPGKPAAGGFASIFTPLALERMFEPPTPPPAAAAGEAREPSPPQSAVVRAPSSARPSPLSQVHLPVPTVHVHLSPDGTMPLDDDADEAPPTKLHIPSAEFTFTVPSSVTPSHLQQGAGTLAESTPGPTKPAFDAATPPAAPPHPRRKLEPPLTDPRLRLFQFQYDTFTREHLSAIVDSIAVGSPSSSHFSPAGSTPPAAALSRVTESTDDGSFRRMRATKRVKLSLASDGSSPDTGAGAASVDTYGESAGTGSVDTYGEGAGAGATISRPRAAVAVPAMPRIAAPALGSRKDWVGESRSLMQNIKATRDFSTVSTVRSNAPDDSDDPPHGFSDAPRPADSPRPFDDEDAADADNARRAAPATNYRQQAMDLMAQIRMGSTRMFSFASVNSDQGLAAGRPPDEEQPQGLVGAEDVEDDRSPTPTLQPAPAPRNSFEAASARTTSSSSTTIPGFVFTGRGAPNAARAPSGQLADDIPKPAAAPTSGANVSPWTWTPSTAELPPAPPALPVPATNAFSRAGPFGEQPAVFGVQQPAVFGVRDVAMPIARRPQSPSFAPARPVPPSFPTQSLRNRAGQDVNRYVSSSTTASVESRTSAATTVTAASSIGSFVKRPGPALVEPRLPKTTRAMTQIKPEDVGTLPQRVGGMVFDSTTNIWHKERVPSNGSTARFSHEDLVENISDDPFRDIESLRDDAHGSRQSRAGTFRRGDNAAAASRHAMESGSSSVRLHHSVHDASVAEIDPSSFSIDDAELGVVQVMTGVEDCRAEQDSNASTESDGEDFLEMTASTMTTGRGEFEHGDPDPSSEVEPGRWQGGLAPESSFTAQALPPLPPLPRVAPVVPPTPVIRPAIRSMSVTPISAIRGPSRFVTPAPSGSGHRRSVSFSDGKREGQIHGLGRLEEDSDIALDERDDDTEDRLLNSLHTGSRSVFVPSARSKRVADMLDGQLEDSLFAEGSGSGEHSDATERPDDTPRAHELATDAAVDRTPRRSFSRSNAFFTNQPAKNGDATFLTEWSFGVAHDRIVSVITDVHPFKPDWEELDAIDLNGRALDSVVRLKEFLPKLDALSINGNQLTYLTGIPEGVRTLSVTANCLSSTTSFHHLMNLENLDISRNDLDSLLHLQCLRHLRELRADGNRITSTDGLEGLDGLVKLSLQGNRIRQVDFAAHRWPRLEMLNISDNRLDRAEHLESLSSIIALNLDNNLLTALDPNEALSKLRVLRVSGNKIQRISGAVFPNLRTLYADSNNLSGIDKAGKLAKLENLSLRNQYGKGLRLSVRDVRDVKRLYLSGNALDNAFLQEACYNLLYLELAACRLTVLPANFSALAPNLRILNLNYNFISDLRPLEGLDRLRKLTLIGSRLTTSKALIKCVRGMPDVEMLDFRMNPCTLGWYLPLLVRDVPGALQPSEGKDPHNGCRRSAHDTNAPWQDLDAKFRKDLPDDAYIGRLAYRGLVMRACPAIRMLDGVAVTAKERDKATRLLDSILSKRQQAPHVSADP